MSLLRFLLDFFYYLLHAS